MFNDEILERVNSVWKMQTHRHSLAEIQAAHINPRTNKPFSIQQTRTDLRRARELHRMMIQDDIQGHVAEQIEARRRIISEAWYSLRLLRSPVLTYNPDSRTYEPQSNYGDNMVWTAAEAKVVSGLLETIGRQETAIEKLQGLENESAPPRDSRASASVTVLNLGDQDQAPAPTVIDSRDLSGGI